MTSKWIYSSCGNIPQEIKDYCKDDLFAKLLMHRGITTLKKAKEFLEPEANYKGIAPNAFCDMDKATDRIFEAIENEEKIIVYGDFDADGVTSTSLLVKALRHIGADVEYYIPDRIKEGHGLNTKALIALKTKNKAKLVITVDCGISNIAEIKLIKGFGVDVIVTDHHEAGEILPDAAAIINPKAKDAVREDLSAQEIESLNYLAGVGIAYKLACALLDRHKTPEFKKELLPLVAIGTIADVVPLLEENRLLVRLGVAQIRKNCPASIKALIELGGYNLETFDSQSIAFGIAPRINAIGRLEHSSKVVELFTTQNQQEIETHAKYMDDCNKIRQSYGDNIFEEAVSQITQESLKQNKAIILQDKGWHIGIIGIVASKICEKFYRPVFMLRLDEENQKVRCSARGVVGLNLYDVLLESQDLFEVFGGHSMAAGFSADIENLDQIIKNLHNTVNESLSDEFMTPRIEVEEELKESDLSLDFVKKLQLLEPCGNKNNSPLFSLKNLQVKELKTMGTNSNHLKVFLEGEFGVLESVFWGRGEIDAKIADKIDIVFSPKINTFNGKTSVQLELSDYKTEAGKTKKPKIINHMKKEKAREVFFDYLKTTKTSIAIFAESQQTLEFLGESDLVKAIIINRLKTEKVDQVAFFDIPQTKEIFVEILKKTSAKVVHILGEQKTPTPVSETIKMCSGMLKYADNNLEGVVNLEKFGEKLNLSREKTEYCLDFLQKAKIIDILDNNDSEYTIKFLQSKDFGAIKSTAEYTELESKLVAEDIFCV